MGNRPFAIVRTFDQWVRCTHQSTTVDSLEGVVSLATPPLIPPEHVPADGALSAGAGLVFDGACRLYHSLPIEQQVDVTLWAAAGAEPTPLLRQVAAPRGLAVDSGQRLWVAEAGANRLLCFDLHARELVRTVPLGAPEAVGPRPLAVAVAPTDGALGQTVYGVTVEPAGWFRVSVEAALERRTFDPAGVVKAPGRIAVSESGVVVLLDQPGTAAATLYRLRLDSLDVVGAPEVDLAKSVPFATDVAFLEVATAADTNERVELFAVAGAANGRPLAFRYVLRVGGFEVKDAWSAPGYDGAGVVRTVLTDGAVGIGYWSSRGFRVAAAPARSYFRAGQVGLFALDSGEFQTRWGRLFIDACIPAGTSVRVKVLTSDELGDDEERLPWVSLPVEVFRPELNPPLPPKAIETQEPLPLHRRENGSELPWVRLTDGFETYETVIRSDVRAEPGRYLWVLFELRGNGKTSPRIRCVRAEYPAHGLMARLPRVFSREKSSADFLHRMLAPLEGVLDDLDARAQLRQLLVEPDATPEELLPWLASFVGLVMDQRWNTEVRRRFLRETVSLFRGRGTLGSLRRMLELALGIPPVLVERFRMRGVADLSSGGTSTAVLGAGLRVGGAIGEVESLIAGNVDDAFASHAHRFSVFLPAGADVADRARFILESHRPAHTIYDLCTLEGGMRIGLGLHVGLTSFVGHSARFSKAQLGEGALGTAMLGRRGQGFAVGDPVGGDR